MLCSECVPPLLPSNREAKDMYLLCRGQVILGGMEGIVIDLDFSSVFQTLHEFHVKDVPACFKKIKRTFDHFQEKYFEQREMEKGSR